MANSWATAKPNFSPSASGGISRLACARAEKDGIEVETLLRKAGLTRKQIDEADARLRVHGQIKFLDLVADALDDDLLGFHLSQNFDLRMVGLLYYVLASSGMLGEALRRSARYTSIVNEGMKLTICEGNEIRFLFEYVGVPRRSDRHQIEFWIAAFIRMCRELTNRRLSADRVSFAHTRKATSELSTFFGCDVQFGADVDEAVFSPSIRDIAVTSADPYLNKMLIKYCEDALADRKAGRSSLGLNVENAIAVLLPHGKAQSSEVARNLGMSQRTLARRLAAEGLTFAEVLRRLRSDLAEHHLTEKDLSISKIAWLLGYQDVSAFTNAFKRWTGKTPREARQGV